MKARLDDTEAEKLEHELIRYDTLNKISSQDELSVPKGLHCLIFRRK